MNKSKIKKENILSDTVVDWCAGSFMLIHALSFLNVNGFDQKYFMYCEDIDLCMRLKLSGVDLYYTPILMLFIMRSMKIEEYLLKHFDGI
ncbi:galactosyltransferase-related protein [Escherichia coli]